MVDWEQVRINAAINALEGLVSNGKLGELLEVAPNMVAKQCARLADALVSELKNTKIRNEEEDYAKKRPE